MQYEDPALINAKAKIIDQRIITTVLFILSRVVSVVLLYDDRQDILGKQSLFTESEAKAINSINSTVALILISYLQYLNYHERGIIELERQPVWPIDLDIGSSYLLITAALISMYSAYTEPIQEEEISLV